LAVYCVRLARSSVLCLSRFHALPLVSCRCPLSCTRPCLLLLSAVVHAPVSLVAVRCRARARVFRLPAVADDVLSAVVHAPVSSVCLPLLMTRARPLLLRCSPSISSLHSTALHALRPVRRPLIFRVQQGEGRGGACRRREEGEEEVKEGEKVKERQDGRVNEIRKQMNYSCVRSVRACLHLSVRVRRAPVRS
jgi:hypothetical protein